MRCACIDVGSNTTRLLVADTVPGGIRDVVERARVHADRAQPGRRRPDPAGEDRRDGRGRRGAGRAGARARRGADPGGGDGCDPPRGERARARGGRRAGARACRSRCSGARRRRGSRSSGAARAVGRPRHARRDRRGRRIDRDRGRGRGGPRAARGVDPGRLLRARRAAPALRPADRLGARSGARGGRARIRRVRRRRPSITPWRWAAAPARCCTWPGASSGRTSSQRALDALCAEPAEALATRVGLDPVRVRLLPAGVLVLAELARRLRAAACEFVKADCGRASSWR